AFVDSNRHDATSTDINTYNGFITTDASVITYPGGTIGMWQVIGSTEASNAATPLFTDLTTGVYGTNNQQIATSGQALISADHVVYDQHLASQIDAPVFTGLFFHGTTLSVFALGEGTGLVEAGSAGLGPFWLSFAFRDKTDQLFLYGYAEFTVGPTT